MGKVLHLLGARPPANEEPKVAPYLAFGGAIRILEPPTAEDWEVRVDQGEQFGFSDVGLIYGLPFEDLGLVLSATITTFKPPWGRPNDPVDTDWRAATDEMVSSISYLKVRETAQLTMSNALRAAEAVVHGLRPTREFPVRFRERRSVLGDQEFVLTAYGTSTAFEEHADEIETWFDSVRFVPIGEATPGSSEE